MEFDLNVQQNASIVLERGRAARDLLSSDAFMLSKAFVENFCKEEIFRTAGPEDSTRKSIWDRYHAYSDLEGVLRSWADQATEIERALANDEFNPAIYSPEELADAEFELDDDDSDI